MRQVGYLQGSFQNVRSKKLKIPVNLYSETPLYKRKAKLYTEQKERKVQPNTNVRTIVFI